MESNTKEGIFVDIGSLYTRLEKLSDSRKPRGKRYRLQTVLVLLILAKICGQDRPSGIAEWAQNRKELLAQALGLKRVRMPHHSTYRRILADVVAVEELELITGDFLRGKKFHGKQVLLAIDGKVLRGTLDEQQRGTYLLAAYLPAKG